MVQAAASLSKIYQVDLKLIYCSMANSEQAGTDIFDGLYSIEQTILDKGFDAGEAQGRSSGVQEGWEMG